MPQSRENLEKLLKLVTQVANEPGNEWFKNEISTTFGGDSKLKINETATISENYIELKPIKNNTEAIRNHLEIRGDNSIDYKFITNNRVKKQLLKDNLRMENIRLNLYKDEDSRFFEFCSNAFYQIEELINYYFGTKYSFEEFLSLIRKTNPTYNYNQKQLSEIKIAEKIFLFENIFFHNQKDDFGKLIYYESVLNSIKNVRNEDSHRCNLNENNNSIVLKKYDSLLEKLKNFKRNNLTYEKSVDEKEIEKLAKQINFLKDKNYNLVRDTIQSLCLTIKNNL